jgi:hypothetical protein
MTFSRDGTMSEISGSEDLGTSPVLKRVSSGKWNQQCHSECLIKTYIWILL